MARRYVIREVLFEEREVEDFNDQGLQQETLIDANPPVVKQYQLVPVAVGSKLMTNANIEIKPITDPSRKWIHVPGIKFEELKADDLEECIDVMYITDDGDMPNAFKH